MRCIICFICISKSLKIEAATDYEMTQPTTLDERIFAALEKTIDYFAENIPPKKKYPLLLTIWRQTCWLSFSRRDTVKDLPWSPLDVATGICRTKRLLTVDTLYEVKYRLNHPLTGELRSGSCFQIFAKYEKYLMVNSEEIPAYQIKSIIDLNNGEKIL